MDIINEVSFFVKKLKTKDGERTIATTTISRTFEGDTKPVKRSIDVIFNKQSFGEEKLSKLKEDTCYTMQVEAGWITLTRYKKANQQNYTYDFALHIKAGKLLKATPVDVEKREKAREEAKAQKQAEKADDGNPLNIVDDDLPF